MNEINNPKISIIVPVYNAEVHLCDCIDSLINQTERDLQIILVNDGSKDTSGAICDEYAERDARVKVIHKENGGVSSARNAGLDNASGEWIGFVDSDDTILPDMYEYMLGLADEHGADIVQCAMFFDTEDESRVILSPRGKIIAKGKADINTDFFRYFSGSSCIKLYRRKIIEGIRYDEQLVIGEDMRFNLDALTRSSCTVLAPKPKYRYSQRADSACNSTPTEKKLTSYSAMLKRAEDDFSNIDCISEFLRAETVRNALDVCSKATRFGSGRFKLLFSEAREDIISLSDWISTSDALTKKERFKAALVARHPRIYKFLIGKLKK